MLLGRVVEQGHLDALVDADGTSGAVVVRREPGIGKTTLLLDVQALAEGMHVLRARGVEAEAELAFSGVLELVRPILDRLDRV